MDTVNCDGIVSKKKRLEYVDAIRAIAVALVVLEHFNVAMPSYGITIAGNYYVVPGNFSNGSLGTLGVSLFFIISGMTLFYNYEESISIKRYAKKRFLHIYLPFWSSYLLIFLCFFVKYKKLWFHNLDTIPVSSILLTLFGMDGYFKYLGDNFYLLGEWFLGCIIMLYVAFPLMRICVKKQPVLTYLIATAVYVLVVWYQPFQVGITRNVLVRGYDFLFGMLLGKWMCKMKIKWYIPISGGVLFVIAFMLPPLKHSMFAVTMTGWGVFLLLTGLFSIILKKFGKSETIRIISKYSYEIFLLHHVWMNWFLSYFRNHAYSYTESLILLLLYMIGLILLIRVERIFRNWVKIYCQKLWRKQDDN